VSGRWKPALYCTLAGGILGVLSLVSLGQDGINSYITSVNFTKGNPIHSVLTFAWFGRGLVATSLEVTAGVAALLLAWYRRDRMDLVFALGIVGSTASAFYLHEYDATVFIAIGVFWPMVLWEAGWIAMLGLEPWLAAQIRQSPVLISGATVP
jgi:hypothetical protein